MRGEPVAGIATELLERGLHPRVARVALELQADQREAVRIDAAETRGDDARRALLRVRVGGAGRPLYGLPIRLPGRKTVGDRGDGLRVGQRELAAVVALDEDRRRRGALDLAERVAAELQGLGRFVLGRQERGLVVGGHVGQLLGRDAAEHEPRGDPGHDHQPGVSGDCGSDS
jgi:hypothetical protein